jgi:UDP-N-acetylglucosamine 2-epimerase
MNYISNYIESKMFKNINAQFIKKLKYNSVLFVINKNNNLTQFDKLIKLTNKISKLDCYNPFFIKQNDNNTISIFVNGKLKKNENVDLIKMVEYNFELLMFKNIKDNKIYINTIFKNVNIKSPNINIQDYTF